MYYPMQGNLPTNLDCLPLGEHNSYSAQGVSYNKGRGMESFSEEGLEACHTYIGHFRGTIDQKNIFRSKYIFHSFSLPIRLFFSYPKKNDCLQKKQKEAKFDLSTTTTFDSMAID